MKPTNTLRIFYKKSYWPMAGMCVRYGTALYTDPKESGFRPLYDAESVDLEYKGLLDEEPCTDLTHWLDALYYIKAISKHFDSQPLEQLLVILAMPYYDKIVDPMTGERAAIIAHMIQASKVPLSTPVYPKDGGYWTLGDFVAAVDDELDEATYSKLPIDVLPDAFKELQGSSQEEPSS